MNTTAKTGPGPLMWPFFAWAVLGAAACAAVLSVLGIGVFAAPVVIIAMFALLRWPRSRTIAWFGAVSGAGLVILYIAYLNRRGLARSAAPSQAVRAAVQSGARGPASASGLPCSHSASPLSPWLGPGSAGDRLTILNRGYGCEVGEPGAGKEAVEQAGRYGIRLSQS